MKKYIIFLLLLTLMLPSCTTIKTEYVSLEELPKDYTFEDAEEDGCVGFANGDIAFGKERWLEFANVVPKQKATVRLANYYELGDPSKYGEEYYESVKDEYPKLFVKELSWDGEYYTLHWFEGEKEYNYSYKYMLRFEGEAPTEHATYDRCVRYVLVNDNTVTWEELEWGLFSSQMGDYIPHTVVYTDFE